ncbi:MAG TPA: winged helix-turn-helix transcriptional regulator [Pseudoneobacillus sp.]|nr:winged helix-turn-helix transcriptional regulator [Pseudoneobacillus sp.]
MKQNLDQQSETRKAILMALKQNGSETIASLVSKLNISSEGVRLHLVQLERDGLIKRYTERSRAGGGRPAIKVRLTSKGETLFPKQYDALTIEVIDTVANQLGPDAVKRVLSTMAEARVREWEWRLEGLTMVERVETLKDLYIINDQYMDVECSGETIRLIERNCPFYDVAMQRPVLCNVTLSTLTRLLGCRVVREKSFQNGDGCCVFRINKNEPVDVSSAPFLLEE